MCVTVNQPDIASYRPCCILLPRPSTLLHQPHCPYHLTPLPGNPHTHRFPYPFNIPDKMQCFINVRFPNIELRKSVSWLVMNLAVILAAFWLVCFHSLLNSELITDSWTRQSLLKVVRSCSNSISNSTRVGHASGGEIGSRG